jgi:hypothetical protein
MSKEPSNRHTMDVRLGPGGSMTLTPVCHEPDGAICRVNCPEGCESYSYPDHEHGLESQDFCNAVEWLTDQGTEECYKGTKEIPISDGMAIRVIWHGDHYEWAPVSTDE